MLPKHIAFIMDGNGRWASSRGLPRSDGYAAGFKAFKRVVDRCAERGIQVVSVYAFSTENSARPTEEISAVFKVITKFNLSYEGDMKIRYIGAIDELPDDVLDSVDAVEYKTADNSGMTLVIALNYGSRDDIVRACKLAYDHNDFTERGFENHLSTCGLPPLDAVVRTGGERRLSNFMLYECAYSELFFLDKLWPDMTENDVDEILCDFEKRNRKFGA